VSLVPEMFSEQDYVWMTRALELARQAGSEGEVPVGAVLVKDNKLLASAFNQPISLKDPSAHAEILVLRKAASLLENYRLVGTELFVTIEPCLMCAGALVHSRVKRLVFGAREQKAGAICSHFHALENDCLNHRVEVEEGLLAEDCSALMMEFFKKRRV